MWTCQTCVSFIYHVSKHDGSFSLGQVTFSHVAASPWFPSLYLLMIIHFPSTKAKSWFTNTHVFITRTVKIQNVILIGLNKTLCMCDIRQVIYCPLKIKNMGGSDDLTDDGL